MATLTPFRYPGSKNKMLSILMEHIDKLMVDQNAFTDAFVGGGSVALAVATKYPKAEILLNDKDYWIYSFWDIVAGPSNAQLPDLLSILDQPATLEQFYKLRETETDDKLLCAYKAIFFNRTTFSGILKSGPIGGKDQLSKYPVDCRYNAPKLKQKITAISKLLFGRTHVDNLDIIPYLNYRSNQGAIYLDPPYYVKGSALYTEFMTDREHIKMAAVLEKKKNWVLSYDDCKEVRYLYKNYEIIDLAARYCINGKKSAWEKKNELIILP
jgi:DNA adenine methylase